MAIRTEQVSLDIQPCCDARGPVVCGRQGDEGTVLVATVTRDGEPLPLDGLTATLLGNNPELLQLAGTVSGSTATFTLPSAFFSAACIVRLYVQLAQGSDVVASTQTFTLKVAPGADLSASQAQGYVTQLDEALATAQQASQTAETAAAQATQAVDDANEALQTANTAVQNANTAADAANAAASNANSAAQAARGNVLKGTVTDASVAHVEDAYAGAVAKEIRVMGKTSQNLMPKVSSMSESGLTFTVNENGSITILGTQDGSTAQYAVNVYNIKPSTQYTLSCRGLTGTARVLIRQNNVITYDAVVNSSKDTVTFTTIDNLTSTQIFIGCAASSDAINTTIYPMLAEGSTAQPWCPPGLTSVSELETVVAGKNLLKPVDLKSPYEVNGVSITHDGMNFTLSGTPGSAGGRLTYFAKVFLQPGTYAFSRSSGIIGSNVTVCLSYTSDGTIFTSETTTGNIFTIDEPTELGLGFNFVEGVAVNASFTVQLEVGEDITAYEPPAVTTTAIDLDGHELRSLPDGTCDVLTWDETGAVSVEQVIGRIVLDGTQLVQKQTADTDRYDYRIAIDTPTTVIQNVNALMCDRLPVRANRPVLNAQGAYGVAFGVAESEYGSIWINVPSAENTVQSVTQWLTDNPVTVIYTIAPADTDLTPATMPALPESTANVWAACDPPTEVDLVYERDLTIAYDNLAAQIAALNVAAATN